VGVLIVQFRTKRYVPGVYWSAVVLISVVGTLITDNLTDGLNVPLTTTTAVFAVLLAITFAVWYAVEKTLSVHTIVTTRRETFYWLTILFTFALGTAAGDLVAEKYDLGYLPSLALFAGMIAVVTAAHYAIKNFLEAQHRHQSTNAVLAFWLAYILSRPLGASLGDYLSSAKSDGGMGLGTTDTTAVFLAAILALVTYLTLTRIDVTSQAKITAELQPELAEQPAS
jgi:uncharacterized membrane-anchored protein